MRSGVSSNLTYGLGIFSGAFLLFQVQPIIGKAILPWFGGVPSVWTTCMLVFQTLLFLGYSYAHASVTYLSPRRQAILHTALLLLALLTLPILPTDHWKPDGTELPTVHVISILLVSIGLPFLVLSSTGPLLQAWFHRVAPGKSPYRLYALSNFGSLLALVSFPFLFEPYLSLPQLSWTWSGAFLIYAAVCIRCGWNASKFPSSHPTGLLKSQASTQPNPHRTDDDASADPRPGGSKYAQWFILAMTASVMLLAITNQICQDIASMPFLWVMPLAVYLITFIIAFDRPNWYRRTPYVAATLLGCLAMLYLLTRGHWIPIELQMVLFSAALFFSSMFCHGELAWGKPEPRHLTLFYLIISAGGAAGGLLVSVIAPFVFRDFYELHAGILVLAAITTWTLLPLLRRWPRKVSLTAGLSLLTTLALISVGIISDLRQTSEHLISQTRNFYGTLTVHDKLPKSPEFHHRVLLHGRIRHGSQFVNESKRTIPTWYYARTSGIGLALRAHRSNQARRLGFVGMGVGTLAAYGSETDKLTFYEINEDVVRIAQQDFSYLEDCPGECEIALGDARLVLERELANSGPRRFDVLAVDAFSGDSVPTHLLTREAMKVYLDHMAPDGIIGFHITNLYFDLTPVLADLAEHFGMTAIVAHNQEDVAVAASSSTWVLITRSATIFNQPAFHGLPILNQAALDGRSVAWTDDHCSLFAVLRGVSLNRLLVRKDEQEKKIYQAIGHQNQQEFPQAEKLLREVLSVRENDDSVWLQLGIVMQQMGDQTEAAKCFARAVRLNPTSSEAYNNLGNVLAETSMERAAQCYQEAIRLDPRNAQALANAGNLLVKRQRLDAAISYYQQALAINPDHVQAKSNLRYVQEIKQNQPASPRIDSDTSSATASDTAPSD